MKWIVLFKDTANPCLGRIVSNQVFFLTMTTEVPAAGIEPRTFRLSECANHCAKPAG